MAQCEHSGAALAPPELYRVGDRRAPRAVADGGEDALRWRCFCGAVVAVTEDGGEYAAAAHEEGGGG